MYSLDEDMVLSSNKRPLSPLKVAAERATYAHPKVIRFATEDNSLG